MARTRDGRRGVHGPNQAAAADATVALSRTDSKPGTTDTTRLSVTATTASAEDAAWRRTLPTNKTRTSMRGL
jgi:hypothetical protein